MRAFDLTMETMFLATICLSASQTWFVDLSVETWVSVPPVTDTAIKLLWSTVETTVGSYSCYSVAEMHIQAPCEH